MSTYGVVIFDSTKEAMRAEKLIKESKIGARIISSPVELKANCGFSVKYGLEEEKSLFELFEANDVVYGGFFHALADGLKVTYEPIETGS